MLGVLYKMPSKDDPTFGLHSAPYPIPGAAAASKKNSSDNSKNAMKPAAPLRIVLPKDEGEGGAEEHDGDDDDDDDDSLELPESGSAPSESPARNRPGSSSDDDDNDNESKTIAKRKKLTQSCDAVGLTAQSLRLTSALKDAEASVAADGDAIVINDDGRAKPKKSMMQKIRPARSKQQSNGERALGSSVSTPSEPASSSSSSQADGGKELSAAVLQALQRQVIRVFLHDFSSRLWFTYRGNFARILPSQYTTDLGWGCLIRTGQMMLAHAFVCYFLGRDWRLNGADDAATSLHSQIIRWFADTPSPLAPYSLHNVAMLGARFNTKVGECFEPTQIARCLKVLVRRHSPGSMTMYAPRDGVICIDQVRLLCEQQPLHTVASPSASASPVAKMAAAAASSSSESSVPLFPDAAAAGDEAPRRARWRPIIIVVPLRLGGGEKVNPVYISSLKAFIGMPQTLGIVGGKPNHSLWFVAWQDDSVFYYDPHVVQETVDVNCEDFPTDSFHQHYPQKMLWRDIDPSLAIGFLCTSEADFDDLCARINALNEDLIAPCFSVVQSHTDWHDTDSEDDDFLSDAVLREVLQSDSIRL
jgi:Peptidase family C54